MVEEERDKQFWAEQRASWRRPEVVIASVVFLAVGTFAAARGSVSITYWCLILWSITRVLSEVIRNALKSRTSIDDGSAGG